ncbi:putative secreted protein (Por secretion system target) [Jejuia pallidilutea]|uniref:Putative secreted protein (Por secretion system target) n=1 Tax=Jejuia pallidilutea TaxID=504487 RepID=A0A362X3B2_9FLAO|nr:carbohydrate-binding protein [Jejuia pallidilutea]PQV48997.1 putative secreted protein (Por secretion system target) [Jejuia pallidilutea]
MKKTTLLLWLICLVALGFAQAQTAINSLAELKDRLDDSNGNFVMTPGTYYFNTDNCGPGKLFDDPRLLLFTGNNSTFDFTGVKFEIDTKIFTLYGGVDIIEFWPVGSNNTYKNLTLEDIGMTVPTKGAGSIHLDGADNLIEGFKTTVRGSFPYGYGDTFGKGGGSVIRHNKHAGILVRGDRNHLKNCTVIMRAYGHGIFMQGSHDAIVEGCYIEGELRTVGEMLQEAGTGSPADNVDFETVWGFNLKDHTSDYTFSLQEAGIRAYSTGKVFDAQGNNTGVDRQTLNTTVIDCTIIKMRVGVNTGAEGGNNKRIENCTALACEGGFWLGNNGDVINCFADASVGPILSEDIHRSNATYEVTILDNYIPKIGDTPYFFAGGTNHNLTIHDGTTYFNLDIKIVLGGTRNANRFLAGSSGDTPPLRRADNITLINNTKYPLYLEDATGCTIYSCGPVTDNGSGNTVTNLSSCNYNRPCNNRADNLQAECYDNMTGINVQAKTGNNNENEVFDINSGDWISFNNIDLTGMTSINVIASGDKNNVELEVRTGSHTGTLIATIPITSTGNYATYQEFSANLNQMVNGLTDIYFVANSDTEAGWLFNIDKLNFIANPCSVATFNPFLPISAEDFCDSAGVSIESLSIFNDVVGNIENDDYIKFSNVDFGYNEIYNSIDILASSTTSGSFIEVRSGAIDGALLATVNITNTGNWGNYQVFSNYTTTNIEGVHDLYFVFKGGSGSLLKIDNFSFYFNSAANNLALASNGGVASQSSTGYGGEASRANDGDTNGNYGGNSVSHTEHGTEGSLKWWQVDLGENKIIWEIKIYNRTGSNYSADLNNFTVEVINASGDVTFSQFYEDYPNPTLTIDTGDIIGKVVKISKTSARGIQLAEVEVYGTSTLSANDFLLEKIKLYPNPTQENITISNAINSIVEIYNVSGILELKIPISENQKNISLSNFKSGIYFLIFSNSQGTTVKKLIKL